MVSSNKILTVSYGTFSCTLEGFDNSFDTMKAIAEYFRDLAQDDRYFGAEPPTPDAEMLARIAEREIERRVEARFEKGNLVLRPTDEAETPRGDVAPKSSSSDAALVGATAGGAATALAVADAEGRTAPDPSQDGPDTRVDIGAAALSLRDVVAPEMPEIETAEIDIAEVETADIEPEEEVDIDLSDLDLTTEDDALTSSDDVFATADAHADDSSIDDLIASQGAPVVVQQADIEDVIQARMPVTDSVADKLQRIRAVVAAKSQKTPDYIEDEHAMSGPDGDGIDENDAIDAQNDIPGFVDTSTSEAQDASGDTEDEDDILFADTIAAAMSDQIDDDDDVEIEAPDESEDAQSELEALRARIAELEARTAVARSPEPEPETETETETETEEDNTAARVEGYDGQDYDDWDDEDFASEDMESELLMRDAEDEAADISDEDGDVEDAAEETPPAPIIARVSKAKRSDVDAALAAGEIEEYEDEASDAAGATPEAVTGAEDSTLTPEQEAELARELAELHAEIDEDEDWNFDTTDEDEDDDLAFADDDVADGHAILSEANEEEAHANIRKAVKLTSPARAMLTDTPIEEDVVSVDRLADKTETEMDEPEGNRRRSAIAHLRAAVAATKAERLLGFGRKTVDEEEPYREDLADAVRPRRPKVTQSRSQRPAPVRPAPLKLVAEQRIDVAAEAQDAQPVRPRRVLRSADPVEGSDRAVGDDTGFAEFAEAQGAHTLPELLEAAAAYMSFVEGHDQFSRPQLMTKLHQAEGEASSREERLRSFGQLLREGKIQKKGGGRFAASENIGFKPDERAAG